jgi:SagB-type dehydrogenase family enzyme
MSDQDANQTVEVIKLPKPRYKGGKMIEVAILERRSVRKYKKYKLKLAELGQLLWAAQGVSDKNKKFRTVPSAGALYPLQIYALIGDSEELDKGIYKYRSTNHEIIKTGREDVRKELSEAALYQDWISQAATVLLITADFDRTIKWYGERGRYYVLMEAGHTAQNIHLQAASLELGTVVIGAFDDDKVIGCLGLPENEEPLCIMPLGKY